MADNNIIIRQEYFDNIKTAIEGLNQFFTSGFKTKNFPSVDGDIQTEPTIEHIITRLDCVDPTWMEDTDKINDVIKSISDNVKNINPVDGVYETIMNSNNETLIAALDSYIGFKMLQYIADNFQDFGKFVNGIYTFEMFTKPSQYADVMDLFGKFIDLSEIPELDLEEKIFDEGNFVSGLMKFPQITFPENMEIETETERIINRQDLDPSIQIFVDDSVQEAAEVDYFENTKPTHIKYSTKTNKWMISKQFESTVNDLVAALRKCNTTDDLAKYFNELSADTPKKMSSTVIPFILAKTFMNDKKYPNDVASDLEDYTKSYDSIIDKNNGAKRFQNYDLFSTFKADKDGTIDFIEDFFKLNLVNNEDVAIKNNTLLTLFNIFDSRIYLDIMYNVLPEDKKKEQTKDEFVTTTRARINSNSRSKNAYTDNTNPESNEPEAVKEYYSNIISDMHNASISDMMYCEQFHDAIMAEIDDMDNRIYNAGISPFALDEYIGESYNDIEDFMDDIFTEANVYKQRESLQSCVSSLMEEMEKIVKLDNKHQWNNNTFVDTYRTSAGMLLPVLGFSNIHGSSKAHTDIKQTYRYTRRAVKGKTGNLTPEQREALNKLNDLVGDLWASVKMFWLNPVNLPKKLNLFRNDRKQTRVKKIANIARSIVALKQSLEFINSDDFVSEAFNNTFNDVSIYQEASTEQNHERLQTAIKVLMTDMQYVADLVKKKTWTNNACISKFKKGSEAYTNIKQAIKYTNIGYAGAAGIPKSYDKDTLQSLNEKLVEFLKTIKWMSLGLNKNVKQSNFAHKIATLASDILEMKSSLDFVNAPAQKDVREEEKKEETTQESFIDDIKDFNVIVEAYKGELPTYIKDRIKMSDDIGGTSVTTVPVPNDVPLNNIGDLTDSIDAKLDAGGDLSDMIGSGFENNPNKKDAEGKIVVNITNNYTNSFNRDSYNTDTNTTDDHSSGKTTTYTNSNNASNSHNSSDSSHDNNIDTSQRKSSSSKSNYHDNSKTSTTKGSNNNNNSNASVDTKDSSITKKDGEQKLSSGKTIQEMFMFLESKEPQSMSGDAGKPPKEDTLTKAMDRDRKLLAAQQKGKKGLTKAGNTVKAVLKPVTRTKQWLKGVVDSLIRRDEDQVKAEIIENKSYRSMLFKATRLALHLGMIGVAAAIQPYLAVTLVGVEGMRLADRQRLKKEAQRNLETEIEIINEKISDLDHMVGEDIDPVKVRKQKYELMRQRSEVEAMLIQAPKSTIKHPRNAF